MYDGSNRKDVRKAEKEAALVERQRQETIYQIMHTISGRKWMHDILEQCHIFSTSYSREPTTMAFNEGQRDIGLKLLNDIMSASPDSYILMMREQNERRTATELTRSKDANGRDQGPGSAPEPTDLYRDPSADGDETSGDETRN